MVTTITDALQHAERVCRQAFAANRRTNEALMVAAGAMTVEEIAAELQAQQETYEDWLTMMLEDVRRELEGETGRCDTKA